MIIYPSKIQMVFTCILERNNVNKLNHITRYVDIPSSVMAIFHEFGFGVDDI